MKMTPEDLLAALAGPAKNLVRTHELRAETDGGFRMLPAGRARPSLVLDLYDSEKIISAIWQPGGEPQCAAAGFTITGGSPGPMKAATRGAAETDGTSIGLGIGFSREQTMYRFLNVSMTFRYSFAGEVLCIGHASAFVVFPDGSGSSDELSEALTFVRTGRIHECSVIMIGTGHRVGLMSWITAQLQDWGFIALGDIDEVADLIQQGHLRQLNRCA